MPPGGTVMFKGIYLLTHGGVVPGHERFVPPLFKNFSDFWSEQQNVKTLGVHFLTAASGSRDHMAFMSMYQGELAILHNLILSPKYEAIWAVAAQVLKNLSGRLYGTPENQKQLEEIMGGAATAWGAAGLIRQ
jgi:hypothetical protein